MPNLTALILGATALGTIGLALFMRNQRKEEDKRRGIRYSVFGESTLNRRDAKERSVRRLNVVSEIQKISPHVCSVDLSKGGATSAETLETMCEYVLENQGSFDVAFIATGINDILHGIPVEDTVFNMKAMRNICERRKKRVVFLEVPLCPAFDGKQLDKAIAINQISAPMKITYTQSDFIEEKTKVHFKAPIYGLMAQTFVARVEG